MKAYTTPELTLLTMTGEDILVLSTLGFDENQKDGVAPGYDIGDLY